MHLPKTLICPTNVLKVYNSFSKALLWVLSCQVLWKEIIDTSHSSLTYKPLIPEVTYLHNQTGWFPNLSLASWGLSWFVANSSRVSVDNNRSDGGWNCLNVEPSAVSITGSKCVGHIPFYKRSLNHTYACTSVAWTYMVYKNIFYYVQMNIGDVNKKY